jgi:hypothetical protein
VPPPVGRPRAIGVWRPAARFARMRRRLILRQGAGPLRPPWGALDSDRPSHGSRARQRADALAARGGPGRSPAGLELVLLDSNRGYPVAGPDDVTYGDEL